MKPDTAAGARQALLELSRYPAAAIDAAKAIPDPTVAGVWALLGVGLAVGHDWAPDAVVYLGGYPDPFGNVRKEDDFEETRVLQEVWKES